jgi:hypothetical protein
MTNPCGQPFSEKSGKKVGRKGFVLLAFQLR